MNSESLSPDKRESQTAIDTDLLDRLQLAEYKNKELESRLAASEIEAKEALRGALETLREREERLSLVLASAEIGTWDFDPVEGKLLWDDQCREMFGMTPSDPVDYEVFLQRLHPDDRQLTHQVNQDALKGLNNGEYQMVYRTIGLHDNKLRWIRAKGKSYMNEQGVCVRYAGTVIDVTEEKRQEQSLREERERFRLLATTIPQIVWTTDKDGVVDYISDNWQRYTGHIPTYDKFSFRSLMHPDDLDRVNNEWTLSLKNGIPYRGEYRLKNLVTNEYRWYSCTTAPVLDETNQVIKWIGSATDIQDQKNNELILEKKVSERTVDLKQLNERLEKSNSELEQYAYVTSHDLKEPIRKIQMYNSILKTKFSEQLTAEVLDYLSKIDGATTRMSGLIRDLLKYSRISNDFQPVEDVNLDNTIQNLCSEFDYILKEKNITVLTMQLPSIPAIPVQMHQLFFNLFSNAIKFSKEGVANEITIGTSVLTEADKIRMGSLATKGHYEKIVFKDKGIGFTKEDGEKIFGMFHRLNAHNKYEGHGIGLALCRKIVSNHRGMIWADSNENGGASFTIVLPRSQTL